MNEASTKVGERTRQVILDAIIKYIKAHGYSPSYSDICKDTGIKSKASITHHIKIMLKEGIIETDEEAGTTRTIRVPAYKFVKE